MIEIDNKKVQCPNCTELLYKIAVERDGTDTLIFWTHQYENFCIDVIEDSYYQANKSNNYFVVLKELFKIEI